DVAAWSQIGLAIAFVSLALVTPRSALRAGGIHVEPGSWGMRLLAPAWYAGLEAWLATGASGTAPLAVAAIVATAALVLALRAPARAGRGGAVAHVQGERGGRSVRALPSGLRGPLRLWLRDPVERAAFQLATAYLRRDRDVRLRLRPSLVVFALLPCAGLVVE